MPAIRYAFAIYVTPIKSSERWTLQISEIL